MSGQPLVILIGGSLLMDGIAFGLASRPQVNVLQLASELVHVRDCLHCLEPDLIVLESDAPWSESLMALLNEQPDFRPVGSRSNSCRLYVATVRYLLSDTVQELVEIIQEQVTH